MVCKEEVCVWFKDLSGAERIELFCSLLHMCVPIELRFIGSCLEDLARKDFIYLRDAEIKANDIAEIKKLTPDFTDEGTRSRTSLYLALLYSSNNACSHTMFELLSCLEPSLREESAQSMDPVDSAFAEDVILILTMAANHPAFTFSQRQQLYKDLKTVEKLLQELSGKVVEENSNMNHHDVCSSHLEACGLAGANTCDISQQLVLAPPAPSTPQQHCNSGCSGTNTSSQCQSWLSSSPSSAVCGQHGSATTMCTSTNAVYVKSLELKGSPKRHVDRQHEFHIQVTWSNGEVTEATRTYEELHNFHAELIRLFPKDSGAHRQERHIPFIPQDNGSAHSRKELTQQIHKYIRQLSYMPEHIIQCNHMTAFFRMPPLSLMSTVIISPSVLPLGGMTLSSSPSSHSLASSRTGASVDEDQCSADSTSSNSSPLRSHGPFKGHTPCTPARKPPCHSSMSSPRAAIPAAHGIISPINYRYSNSATSTNHSVGATLSSTVAMTTAAMTPVITAVRPSSPMSSPQLSPLSSPYASPSTSSTCHLGNCGGSGCTGSGDCAVSPSWTGQMVSINDWLKKIRLHKYSESLSRYTLAQIVNLTDAALEQMGLTVGARKKFRQHVPLLREQLMQQSPPNGVLMPGSTVSSGTMSSGTMSSGSNSSCVIAVSSSSSDAVLPTTPLLVTMPELSSSLSYVSSVDSSAASMCSEVASPPVSPTLVVTPGDAAEKELEQPAIVKGNTWPRSYSSHEALHQAASATPPTMSMSTNDLGGARKLSASFNSSRPPAPPTTYHVPLHIPVAAPHPQVINSSFVHNAPVDVRQALDMPPVLPFPAGKRPLGPTTIETHPFCQPHISQGMFPSTRMPPPHMMRAPRQPGAKLMSSYLPKTSAMTLVSCGNTIASDGTSWPSLATDAKMNMPSNILLTGCSCTATTSSVTTTMSVATATPEGNKLRPQLIYHPGVNSQMIASNMPPRPNSLQVAPPEAVVPPGVAYEIKGASVSTASEPTSVSYMMYHTASSSCNNNTVSYSSPGFNNAMPYPTVSLTPTQSPAPSGSPAPRIPTTLPPPANTNTGGDTDAPLCSCSSCAQQVPVVTSSYQYSYPPMWPPHGAIYPGAYHMGFIPPATSNGLINPSMSYLQVHPSYNLPNGYSPEVLYTNQANYASVLPPNGNTASQGSTPQQPVLVSCVQYVATPAMPVANHQAAHLMVSANSKANKKAMCCNCGNAGHRGSTCKESTMDRISHIACFRLNYNWMKSDSE